MNSRTIKLFVSVTLLFTVLLTVSMLNAEDWPNWRGPRGDGTSTEQNLPVEWSATKNVIWKVPLTENGHASPIISGDHLFLVSANLETHERKLSAYDRKSGGKLWSKVVLNSPLEKKHKLNSYASSTPATDGKRVFVSFLDRKESVIAAYDFSGKELWKVRPGIFSSVHGYCSSPVLFEELVIINGDHDGNAYLVALNQSDGKTVWKTPRENKRRSYCTPIIREIDGRTQMLLSGSKCVASYNPVDGKRHWIVDGPTEQFVASLVYGHGLVFLTAGFPEKHVMAIDPTGTGNVTKTHIKWWHPKKEAAYVPSPILHDRYLYVVSDRGIGYCYDALTGEMYWRKRMGRRFSASLISSPQGHIYFLDDDGITTVIKSGKEYEVLSKNDLEETTYASLVPTGNQIFIRGEKHLWCIGGTE